MTSEAHYSRYLETQANLIVSTISTILKQDGSLDDNLKTKLSNISQYATNILGTISGEIDMNSIGDKISTLKADDVTTLLNDIDKDNETKDNENNAENEQNMLITTAPSDPVLMKPFIDYENGKYSKDANTQIAYLNDFCRANNGIKNYKQKNEIFHKCEEITPNDIISDKLLQSKWYNFCYFRMWLEQCSFMQQSKSNNIVLPFRFYRNEIGQFDTNRDRRSNFESIMHSFLLKSEKQKNYINEAFYILWNGIYILFTFNGFQYRSDENNGDIAKQLKEFFVTRMVICKIWQDYDKMDRTETQNNEYFNFMIEKWFNNNIKAFEWLINYLTNDISNLFETYCNDEESGIENFFVNKLVVLVHELLVLSNRKQSKMTRETFDCPKEIAKDLKPFFEFVWDCSVYIACYVFPNANINESLYISLFLRWKDETCDYFRKIQFLSRGTLLHCTVHERLLFYTKVLTINGFDLDCPNRSLHTPYDKSEDSPLIRQWFDSYLASVNGKGKGGSFKLSEMESAYLKLKQQKAFSDWFLAYLGCDITHEIDLHNSIFSKTERFSQSIAEMCFDYSELNGINKNKTLTNKKDANNVMNSIVTTTMTLMKHNQPISDDIMILCFRYCKSILIKNMKKDGNKKLKFKKSSNNVKLAQNFMLLFQQVSKDCLMIETTENKNGKDETKEDKNNEENRIKKEMNVRNYQWFRQYLLFSNIWLMQLQPSESQMVEKSNSMQLRNNTDSNNIETNNSLLSTIGTMTRGDSNTSETETDIMDQSALLYDTIDSTIDIALLKQKEYIYNNILMEEKSEENAWNNIINIKDYISNKINHLRQDCIPNGIVSEYDENELWRIAPSVDNRNFDCFEEYNRIFLKKILLAAHSMNKKFQSSMQTIFGDIGKNYFMAAPVKLEERCIVKAQTDYALKKFPSAACLVDVLRCSVTCQSAEDLYYVFNAFIKKVENEQGIVVKDILRIKNGFGNIPMWRQLNNIESYNYVDIKLNILIISEDNSISLIGEIQFLLSWLLKSKKYSHKLYGIKRRKEYIDTVNNMMNDDYIYKKYTKKIVGMISNNNYDHLTQHLIWNPNVIMSMITGIPIMSKILTTSKSGQISLLRLFLSCLSHYDNICINDKTIKFGKKYVNFRNSEDTIQQYYFWGIDTRKLKKNSNNYKMIELIMQCSYFDGIQNDNIMYTLCIYDCFEYLSLIWNYNENNLLGIEKGINKKYSLGNTPLTKLIMAEHCSDDYLQLFLKFGKINKNTKIDLDSSVLDVCKQRGEKGEKWLQMIKQYANETGQKF